MSKARARKSQIERAPVAPDLDPPQRRSGQCVNVKVQLRMSRVQREHALPVVSPELLMKTRLAVHEGIDEAIIITQDEKLRIHVIATAALRGRFERHESKAYFRAEIFEDEIEIGDRIQGASW